MSFQEDEDDADLAALEKQLLGGGDDDDVFSSCELSLDCKALLTQLQSNSETLVGLYPEVEVNDATSKALSLAILKATKLEGITLDGAIITPAGKLS
jgi:hypothetical protein